MTYKNCVIVPETERLSDGKWKLRGTIIPGVPEGSGFGEPLFESQNHYPSKEDAERHFVEFATRFIDGKATRADIDQQY